MTKVIKVCFVDFWDGWFQDNNFFYNMLCSGPEDISIEVDYNAPDIVFFSVFYPGNIQRHQFFNTRWKAKLCTKVFFTGENIRPPFDECDIAFGFDHISSPPAGKKYFRLPLWLLYMDHFGVPVNPGQSPNGLVSYQEALIERHMLPKARPIPCGFVARNAAGPRCNFIKILQNFLGEQGVHCAGPLMNNTQLVGPGERNKLEFLKKCSFSVAFENSRHPGYCTEKLFHALVAGCIPLYWGDPLANKDFNPEAFVHIQRDEYSMAKLTQSSFHDNLVVPYLLSNSPEEKCKAEKMRDQPMWTFDQKIGFFHTLMLTVRKTLLATVNVHQTRDECWNPLCIKCYKPPKVDLND